MRSAIREPGKRVISLRNDLFHVVSEVRKAPLDDVHVLGEPAVPVLFLTERTPEPEVRSQSNWFQSSS
jgi:hypothetical protein